MNRFADYVICFFLLIGLSSVGFAEEKSTDASPSLFERMFDVFVDARDTTSKHYVSMSKGIDNYFSGENIEDTSNGSYMKLTIAETFYKGGDVADDIDLKAKLEIPNTEKHLKLVFSSSPEEEKSVEDRVSQNATGERIEKDSSVAGVEYEQDPTESQWRQSYTAGVKLRLRGLVPVARYKVKNDWQLDEHWKSRFEQSFWYIDDSGFGATNEINFIRPLNEIHTLNLGTDIEFKDDEDRYYYGFTIADYHRLTPDSGWKYRIGLVGESQPTNWVTNYFIGASYRKALYKDWFFFETGPQLSFPRDDGWKPTPSFTARLEIYFSE